MELRAPHPLNTDEGPRSSPPSAEDTPAKAPPHSRSSSSWHCMGCRTKLSQQRSSSPSWIRHGFCRLCASPQSTPPKQSADLGAVVLPASCLRLQCRSWAYCLLASTHVMVDAIAGHGTKAPTTNKPAILPPHCTLHRHECMPVSWKGGGWGRKFVIANMQSRWHTVIIIIISSSTAGII